MGLSGARSGSCWPTIPIRSSRCYVTPHRWTPFFRDAKDRRVIQLDRRRWDYKNQVLANRTCRRGGRSCGSRRSKFWCRRARRPCCAPISIPTARRATACAGTPASAGASGCTKSGAFLVPRPLAQARPDARRILGRAAGRRGRGAEGGARGEAGGVNGSSQLVDHSESFAACFSLVGEGGRRPDEGL